MGCLGASLGSGVGVGAVSGVLGSKGRAKRRLQSHFPVLGLGSERWFGGGRLSNLKVTGSFRTWATLQQYPFGAGLGTETGGTGAHLVAAR